MSSKKFYFGLSILIAIILLFLTREIKSAKNITTKSTDEPVVSETPVNINIYPTNKVLNQGISSDNVIPVVIEYVDLKNKDSRYYHSQIYSFALNTRKIKLVFKHAPVQGFFGSALLAHQAAYCAGKDNNEAFWKFVLETDKYGTKESGIRQAAQSIGMNPDKIWICANEQSSKDAVARDIAEAQQLGLGKPPLVFVNNRKLNLDQDIDIPKLLESLTLE